MSDEFIAAGLHVACGTHPSPHSLTCYLVLWRTGRHTQPDYMPIGGDYFFFLGGELLLVIILNYNHRNHQQHHYCENGLQNNAASGAIAEKNSLYTVCVCAGRC